MPYHVTIIDMFHRGDPDARWDGGTYGTAEAAIASVKGGVDYQLQLAWESEVTEGPPTVQGLVDYIRIFSELPVAFGPDCRMIFSSETYAAERAAEMVAAGGPANLVAPPSSPTPTRTVEKPNLRTLLPAIALIVGFILLIVLSPRR